jgi:hypothetical protein
VLNLNATAEPKPEPLIYYKLYATLIFRIWYTIWEAKLFIQLQSSYVIYSASLLFQLRHIFRGKNLISSQLLRGQAWRFSERPLHWSRLPRKFPPGPTNERRAAWRGGVMISEPQHILDTPYTHTHIAQPEKTPFPTSFFIPVPLFLS